MWALVPCKQVDMAKSRLAPVMSPAERRGLTLAMLCDVLGALKKVEAIQVTLVISSDREAQKCAVEFGAQCYSENCDEGLSEALAAGSNFAQKHGAKGVLAVSGDLPLLSAPDVESALAKLSEKPSVVLASATSDSGTNLLAMKPAGIIPYSYGENSFFKHQFSIRATHIEPEVIRTYGLGLDIDTPEDLQTFINIPSNTKAFNFLSNSGIPGRLADYAAAQNIHGAVA